MRNEAMTAPGARRAEHIARCQLALARAGAPAGGEDTTEANTRGGEPMRSADRGPMLYAVVRLSEDKLFEGELPAWRHRRIHIGLLHEHTAGLVELAAGRRKPDGELAIHTRKRTDHYLPGGGAGDSGWLERLLALAERHGDRDERHPEELFIAPCERSAADGHKESVHQTRWLWVDVDARERLPALWAFLDKRPPHLVVESAGVAAGKLAARGDDGAPEVLGGVHAYWRLAAPLPALTLRHADGRTLVNPAPSEGARGQTLYSDPATGEVIDGDFEVVEEIERANLRLIHALGHRHDEHGKQIPTVACVTCKERGRVLRLAGSRHGESGRYARIVFADLWRAGYTLDELVGDLPDAQDQGAARRERRGAQRSYGDDPYERLSILEVYEALTGNQASATRKVHCPHRDHPDPHPSCDLDEAKNCWTCRSCGRGGSVYQLASAVLGGPTNHDVHGEAFRAARRILAEHFGELGRDSAPPVRVARPSAGEPAHRSTACRS
jgi:hypothetical protein